MRIKRLAALGVALCTLSAWGQNNTVDEVIWLVGDDPILRSDVEAERLNAELSGQQVDESSFCNIAEMIAVQKLFLHQADIDSIEVSETEVIAEVNNRENLYLQNFGSKERIEQFTKKTMRQLRESWKEPIRNGLRMRNMQEKLVGNLKVTPAEVREYFKRQYPEADITHTVLDDGDLLLAIEKFVRDKQIDLIALTTYRRNILARILNPSIAKKMLFHTDTPLLVMHA